MADDIDDLVERRAALVDVEVPVEGRGDQAGVRIGFDGVHAGTSGAQRNGPGARDAVKAFEQAASG